MKKINPLFLFIILLTSWHRLAAGPSKPVVMQWATHCDMTQISTASPDWLWSINKSNDGGYVACGFSSIIGSVPGPSIIKFDPNGNILWHHEYDITGIHSFGVLTEIVESSNGNLAAIGYQFDGPSRAILIVTDKDGNQLNTGAAARTYRPLATAESGTRICVAPDGDYLITVTSTIGTNKVGFIEKTSGFYPGSISVFNTSGFYPSNDAYFSNIKIGNVLLPRTSML